MEIKYTRNKRTDGLGGQTQCLRDLLVFADKFGLRVLFDLRDLPFFQGANAKYYSDEEANRLLDFQCDVIYHSKDIDSIETLNFNPSMVIADWSSWYPLQREIIQWLSFGGHDHPVGYGRPNEGHRGTWKSLLAHVNMHRPHEPARRIGLPFRLKDRAKFESLLPRVKNSTVVHGRFGNGEEKFTADHYGFSCSKSVFYTEMEKHDGDFFVCSDDVTFFNECRGLFGDRVFCSERDWLPYGSGPGHNMNQWPYDKKTEISPWVLFRDSLLDMELLCEGKHIICNDSQFNYFARQRIDPESTTALQFKGNHGE